MSAPEQTVPSAQVAEHGEEGTDQYYRVTANNLPCFLTDWCAHRSLCYVLPIFNPNHKFKVIWNGFVILALLISCIQIPFALAFDLAVSTDNASGVLLLMIDVFLCVDIAVTFRTAYFDEYDPLKLITDPLLIAKRYLRFWFWFDLITSFPFDFIMNRQAEGFAHYVKILRMIRLIRITRIVRALRLLTITGSRWSISPSAQHTLNIIKILFGMLFISHLFGCIWWSVGSWMLEYDSIDTWIEAQGLDDDDIPISIKYSTALYWSVITLFTIGYGDISASTGNIAEQYTAIFCVGVGACFTAWFIGTFSALLVEGDAAMRESQDAVNRAILFCDYYKMPERLTQAIILQTQHYYGHNFVACSEEDVMKCLPHYLQQQIRHRLASKRFLKQIDFLKKLPKEVLGELTMRIKQVGCNAGQYVYREGDPATEFYVQRQGESRLWKKARPTGATKEKLEGKKIHPRVKRGDVVGEYCLKEPRRRSSLKCKMWSEFYVLSKHDVQDCLDAYYHDQGADKVEDKVQEEMKEMERILTENKERRVVDLHQADDEELMGEGHSWHFPFRCLMSDKFASAQKLVVDAADLQKKDEKHDREIEDDGAIAQKYDVDANATELVKINGAEAVHIEEPVIADMNGVVVLREYESADKEKEDGVQDEAKMNVEDELAEKWKKVALVKQQSAPLPTQQQNGGKNMGENEEKKEVTYVPDAPAPPQLQQRKPVAALTDVLQDEDFETNQISQTQPARFFEKFKKNMPRRASVVVEGEAKSAKTSKSAKAKSAKAKQPKLKRHASELRDMKMKDHYKRIKHKQALRPSKAHMSDDDISDSESVASPDATEPNSPQ